MVNLSQGFKDMLTLLREAGHGVYKIASGVNQAVGQHEAEALRHISGESVTHLDGRIPARSPLLEKLRHILPRMSSAREEERDAMPVMVCQDGGGKHCLAGGITLGLSVDEGEESSWWCHR
jgi:hypothetical protein